VPDAIDDEHAIFADPFSVSLHSITRHPPPAGGRALVWGAGSLGSCAIAILRALHPDVEVGVVARFDAQADFAARLGAHRVFRLQESQQAMVEELAEWSGGVLRPTMEGLPGIPMCHPGGIDVAYDTVGKPETFEVEVRVLKARGTLVKSGVHAPGRWEWSPLYFKEISWVGSNAFGVEEVDGVRKHAIQHYLDLVQDGRIDLTGMLTHTFGLSDWQTAFGTIADQERTGAIKVAIDPQR
jgi:threonine dehydrogenase-like Zn-dependent dehydrogenase